jgi:hypothetical protein
VACGDTCVGGDRGAAKGLFPYKISPFRSCETIKGKPPRCRNTALRPFLTVLNMLEGVVIKEACLVVATRDHIKKSSILAHLCQGHCSLIRRKHPRCLPHLADFSSVIWVNITCWSQPLEETRPLCSNVAALERNANLDSFQCR